MKFIKKAYSFVLLNTVISGIENLFLWDLFLDHQINKFNIPFKLYLDGYEKSDLHKIYPYFKMTKNN